MLSTQFNWNTPKIPENGVVPTVEEWENYTFEPTYKEYLIQKDRELKNGAGSFKNEHPGEESSSTVDMTPKPTPPPLAGPPKPAGNFGEQRGIANPRINVADRQFKPALFQRTDTSSSGRVTNKRKSSDKQQGNPQNDQTPVYYVPPKKSKPGMPIQEGSYVERPLLEEKTSNNKSPVKKSSNKKASAREEQKKQSKEVNQPIVTQPMFKGRCLPFPRPSWLTKEEQKQFIQLHNLYGKSVPKKLSPQQVKQLALLKELSRKVQAEQEEFAVYLEENALKFQQDYAYLNDEARRYIQERSAWQIRRAKNCPPYYVQQDSVSMLPPKILQYFARLEHKSTLLQIGMIPKIVMHPNVRFRVNKKYDVLDDKFPTYHTDLDPSSWVCSNDSNIKKLLESYDAEIVAAESSLACLIDNHGPMFERQWEMPVRIVNLPAREGCKGPRKVIFMDKPLPSKTVRTRSQNHRFHKYCLLSHLQHVDHKSSVYLSNQLITKAVSRADLDRSEEELLDLDPRAATIEQPSEEDGDHLFGSGTADLDQLETFGRDLSGKRTGDVKAENIDEESSGSESDGSGIQQADGANDGRGRGRGRGGRRGRDQVVKTSPAKSSLMQFMRSVVQPSEASVKVTRSTVKRSETLPQAESNVIDLSVDLSSPPTKRRRGRPRKNVTPVPAEVSDESKEVDEKSTTSGDLAIRESPRVLRKSRSRVEKDLTEKKSLTLDQKAQGDSIRSETSEIIFKTPPKSSAPSNEQDKIRQQSLAAESSDGTQSDGEDLVIDCDLMSPEGRDKGRKMDIEDTPASPGAPASPDMLQSPTRLESAEGPKIIPLSPYVSSERSYMKSLPELSTLTPKRQLRSKADTSEILEPVPTMSSKNRKNSWEVKKPESQTESIQDLPLNSARTTADGMEQYESEASVEAGSTEEARADVTATNVEGPSDSESSMFMQRSKEVTVEKTQPNDSESQKSSTLDQILQSQDELMLLGRPTENEDDNLQSVNICPTSNQQENWKPQEDVKNYTKPPHKHNLMYDLWDLSGISVLIRTHIHGVMHKLKKGRQLISCMTVAPKLEYQPQFGHEQLTRSEVCRAWLSNQLKPNAKHLRVRINAYNSGIMMSETIVKSSQQSLFSPDHLTTMLYDVFSKLKSLPAGDYLLGHAPGNKHAHIQKNVRTSTGVYDLHKAYHGVMDSPPESGVPWIPIDCSLMTDFHKKQNRIPGTFEPKDSAKQKQPYQKPQFQKSKKKKKKKNRGTKKK